jgi:SAM-dependent methyltransferase
MKNSIAQIDIDHLAQLRANVEDFMKRVGLRYGGEGMRLLDIAPQDHKGAQPFFPAGIIYETLDIDPKSGATFIADLCNCSKTVGHDRYDYVVCTEVLEHTRQPFDAVQNIFNILKPGGLAFISTPFNFRIHGPLPDCWRFTEHGLRELFKSFEISELNGLESQDRFLMPIQYTLVARKPKH